MSLRVHVMHAQELLESVSSGTMEEESGVEDNRVSNDTESGLCFKVVRTIGTDALLVSWSVPGGRAQDNSSSGYEVRRRRRVERV
jgi:hypothetical protein